jgi:hypothetical protein
MSGSLNWPLAQNSRTFADPSLRLLDHAPVIKYLDNGTFVLERTDLSGIDNSDGGRWSDRFC